MVKTDIIQLLFDTAKISGRIRRYRANGKRIVRPIDSAHREGIAIQKAQEWRSTIKSKAQVKSRANKVKYHHGFKKTRFKKYVYSPYEDWTSPQRMETARALLQLHKLQLGDFNAADSAQHEVFYREKTIAEIRTENRKRGAEKARETISKKQQKALDKLKDIEL